MPLRVGIGIGVSFGGNPYAGIAAQLGFVPGVPTVNKGSVVPGGPTAFPGWTFSRASTGYAQKLDGTLVSFGSDVPRITDQGILIEGAATNLLTYSQDFTNAAWIQSGATVTPASTAAPDGTLTGQTLALAAGTSFAEQPVSTTVTAGTAWTMSVWLKASASIPLQIGFNGSTNSANNVGTNITVTTQWTRYTFTLSSAGADSGLKYIISNNLFTGGSTAAATVYIWGAQLETGTFATSYIPTTTASATRAADNARITGLSISSPITLVASTSQVQVTGANQALAALGDGTANNGLAAYRGSTQTVVNAEAATSGSGTAAVLTGPSGVTSLKVATSFDGANVKGSVNGGAVGSTAKSGPISPTSIFVGEYWTQYLPLFGYVRSVTVLPNANGNLQTLSSGQ